jgi:hypothetical protein
MSIYKLLHKQHINNEGKQKKKCVMYPLVDSLLLDAILVEEVGTLGQTK